MQTRTKPVAGAPDYACVKELIGPMLERAGIRCPCAACQFKAELEAAAREPVDFKMRAAGDER